MYDYCIAYIHNSQVLYHTYINLKRSIYFSLGIEMGMNAAQGMLVINDADSFLPSPPMNFRCIGLPSIPTQLTGWSLLSQVSKVLLVHDCSSYTLISAARV